LVGVLSTGGSPLSLLGSERCEGRVAVPPFGCFAVVASVSRRGMLRPSSPSTVCCVVFVLDVVVPANCVRVVFFASQLDCKLVSSQDVAPVSLSTRASEWCALWWLTAILLELVTALVCCSSLVCLALLWCFPVAVESIFILTFVVVVQTK
jgi:hypothetical protein